MIFPRMVYQPAGVTRIVTEAEWPEAQAAGWSLTPLDPWIPAPAPPAEAPAVAGDDTPAPKKGRKRS